MKLYPTIEVGEDGTVVFGELMVTGDSGGYVQGAKRRARNLSPRSARIDPNPVCQKIIFKKESFASSYWEAQGKMSAVKILIDESLFSGDPERREKIHLLVRGAACWFFTYGTRLASGGGPLE